MGQLSFFDCQNTLDLLSKQGDPLEKLNSIISWKIFKPMLKRALKKERKSNAGRLPYDYLMMFKVMILQRMYNLSDAQMQFQILDRYSFKRFLNISDENKIPDEKTIWLFRETLTNTGVIERLFNKFNIFLEEVGYKAKKGQLIDASFVEVPKQRNSREENEMLKNGKKPSEWENDPAKDRQKEKDAKWTKKNGKSYYGHKNHINADVKYKLIRKYKRTSAETHDSQPFPDLLDKKNNSKSVWADNAYSSVDTEDMLKQKHFRSNINRKGYRNKSLSEFQIKLNHKKSKIRCRVEHVFGYIENSMKSGLIRCIGANRADGIIGLINLVYNMNRYVQLLRYA